MSVLEFMTYFVSINQILLGILLLIFKKNKSHFIKVFASLNLGVGFTILLMLLYQIDFSFFQYLFGIEYILGFSQGPIFLLLTRAALEDKLKWETKNVFPFLPAFLMILFYFILLLFPNIHSQFNRNLIVGNNLMVKCFDTLSYSLIFLSTIYCLIILKTNQKLKKINYSRFELLRIKLLTQFYILHLMLAPAAAFAFYSKMMTGYVAYFGIIAFIIYIYFIYKLLNEPKVLSNHREQLVNEDRICKELLTEKHLSTITLLQAYMVEEKPYLEKNLNLFEFAHKVNLSPSNLQSIIKACEGTGFNEFVNGYRLEHAKNMLINGEFNKYTIDAIAEMSGFNSRSNFYDLFRKHYGLSPLQYRKHFSTSK